MSGASLVFLQSNAKVPEKNLRDRPPFLFLFNQYIFFMFTLRALKVLIKKVYMKYLQLQGAQEKWQVKLHLNNLQFTYAVIIKTKVDPLFNGKFFFENLLVYEFQNSGIKLLISAFFSNPLNTLLVLLIVMCGKSIHHSESAFNLFQDCRDIVVTE